MRAWYSDHFELRLPRGHRFPMHKYARLRERLVAEGVLASGELFPAARARVEDVLAVHAPEYVHAFLAGGLPRAAVQRIGFPWSRALVARSLASVGGTVAAAEAALDDGLAGALAGGTHHAHRDFGSGYCVFNDLAIAARRLLERRALARVLVFDVDVHQGDGTAAIFEHESRVTTCSIHGARNFPGRKRTSDVDVALPDGTGDEEYLDALDEALERALELARPELVLYQGGVDVLAQDRLGRLSLSLAGVRERDRRALLAFRRAGIPVALTLGGGYAEPVDASLEAHLGTWRVALDLERRAAPERA